MPKGAITMAPSDPSVSGGNERAHPTEPSGKRSIVVLGQLTMARLPLGRGTMTIGRDPACTIAIEDSTVSRKQAILHVDDGITIEDADSTSGTAVGDTLLAPRERRIWREGEVVRVGRVRLVLICDDTAGPRKSATSAAATPARVLRDPAMVRLDGLTRALAAGDISVLLTGETGTGKEIFAEAIHQYSPRASRPLLSLNCASLNQSLLESELFGHVRGAFTGAVQAKVGLLESADGGTVFLDEVGEMPPSLQVKLLRVLEERRVTRVGALQGTPIDIRVVSATNRDLEEESEKGRFRKDLYYRLNGATLRIPPLRERPCEIEPLARMFVRLASDDLGLPEAPEISCDALASLQDHDWPGNIRELRNVISRAVLLCQGEPIQVDQLVLDSVRARSRPVPSPDTIPVLPTEGQEISEDHKKILDALRRCAGNQTRAAKMLGVSRSTLLQRLVKYGIPRPKSAPVA
jgi:transcriptional regulator with PAS, ATPase and Fis domain